MEYAECKERAKCFAQVNDRGRMCCKILLAADRDGRTVEYPDGKCPFFKRESQDKPRRFGAKKKGG
ncbi:MAG: hypothetical protein II738_03610 [Clostridia bacterium]|nr:hypothetical protein [Clostridia bacterium]